MIKNLFSFFNGTYRVIVCEDDKVEAVNLMYKYGITCYKAKRSSTKDYEFVISRQTRRYMQEIFERFGIKFSISKIKGFPVVLKFLLRRPGFLVGAVTFALFISYASNVIWKVNVVGNKNLSETAVASILEEFGCAVGDYIPNINFDRLHANILAERDDISWISVNMTGTVANVEIRESRHGESFTPPEGTYANIVAGEDAKIYTVEVKSGKSVVKTGAVVKKGDLLITGVVPVRPDKIRYSYAQGSVMGYVSRHVSVEIPFESEKKLYSGRIRKENRIKIFKKYINLSLKGGIEYAIYDKIENREQVSIWGIIDLPIWIESTEYREYSKETVSLSGSEIFAKGFADLREGMDLALLDAELVSVKYTKDVTEDAFIIAADMICLTDIAQTSEFTVVDQADR